MLFIHGANFLMDYCLAVLKNAVNEKCCLSKVFTSDSFVLEKFLLQKFSRLCKAAESFADLAATETRAPHAIPPFKRFSFLPAFCIHINI